MLEPSDSPSKGFVYTERDLLMLLMGDVRHLTRDVKDWRTGIDQDLRGLHGRVRTLENFRWWLLGAAGLAGFLGSAFGGHVLK